MFNGQENPQGSWVQEHNGEIQQEALKPTDTLTKAEMRNAIKQRVLNGDYSGIHSQSPSLDKDLTFWITSTTASAGGERPSHEEAIQFLIELMKIKPKETNLDNVIDLQRRFDDTMQTFLFNTIRATGKIETEELENTMSPIPAYEAALQTIYAGTLSDTETIQLIIDQIKMQPVRRMSREELELQKSYDSILRTKLVQKIKSFAS